MKTDPRALPGADPHTGNREVDPVTGYDTTGHEWGGIKELNTPFPRIALVALALTFAYSVIAWILLPAWPLGRDYTRGLLGLEQGKMAVQRLRDLTDRRSDWVARFDEPNFAALSGDAVLLATVMPAAERLYQDNCAACHGPSGDGGPGFPVLHDERWLWGGTPEEIATTIRAGINADHSGTRWAEMPAFDWMDRSDRLALSNYVATLPLGAADNDSAGAVLFGENCTACHGERGVGGLLNGAPALNDRATIYGQDPDTVVETLLEGRQGVMPAWSDRLSDAEINLLALYVAQLSREAAE